MKNIIQGKLEEQIGHGIDGGEYRLVLDNRTIIFANCGLKGLLKRYIGKIITITIEE
jgi:hypothetical protein